MPRKLILQPLETSVSDELAPQPEPSLMERLGGLRGLGAGGLRALTGVASAEGGPLGATISGAGELGAEALEGSLFNQSIPRTIARTGAAGVIGAVPFGAILKAGRPIASALRGATYSGGGEALREWATGENPDLQTVATAAGTGGLFTGGLSGIMKMLGMSKAATAVPKTSYTIEPTTLPGGRVLTGGKISGKADALTGAKFAEVVPPRPIYTDEPILSPREIYLKDVQTRAATAKLAKAGGQVPSEILPEVISSKPIRPGGNAFPELETYLTPGTESGRVQKIIAKETSIAEKAKAAEIKANLQAEQETAKLAEEQDAAARIAAQKEELGLEPKTPTVSESISAKIPGGRERMSIRYAVPEALESELLSAGVTKPVSRVPPKAATPLAKLLKTRTSVKTPEGFQAAVEKNLAGIKEPAVEGAGVRIPPVAAVEPTTIPPIESSVPPSTGGRPRYAGYPEVETEFNRLGDAYRAAQGVEKRGLGAELSELRQFMEGKKMRPEWRGKVGGEAPAVAPAVEAAVEPAADWVQKQSGIVDKLAALAKEQKGAVDPMLLARLGLGAAGAATGAITDPLDDRAASTIAGGVAGFVAPSAIQALSKLGAPKEALHLAANMPNTAEGIKEAVGRIGRTLPQLQRFNYLLSAQGLAANAVVGPYGSAFFGALEAGLKGDPRGWAALRELNPGTFIKDFKGAWVEAQQLISKSGERILSRAEGPAMSSSRSIGETVLSTPGTLMTAGDVVARNALERAGFTAEEARRITLTSEPELQFPKDLANLGKRSPLMQMLFPFRRTPANILEQGSMRLPGIGSLVQRSRAVPDSLKNQMVQQGLGLGVGTASAALGANVDPETAKVVRRFVTNAGGQYSLPAALGFSAGQAMRNNKPVVPAMASSFAFGLPLPTAEPITEWGKFIGNLPESLTQGPYPGGAIPATLKQNAGTIPDLTSLFGNTESTPEAPPTFILRRR